MRTKLGELKSVLGTGWGADLAEGSPFHVLMAKRAGRAHGSHGWPVQGSWGSSGPLTKISHVLCTLPSWPPPCVSGLAGEDKPSLTHNTP